MSILEYQGKTIRNLQSSLPYIDLAARYIEDGNEHDARRIILQRRRIPGQDASHYAKWAELCEDLGMSRQAIESWQMALAQDSTNGEYLYRLGILLFESGNIEKAIKFLRKSLDNASFHIQAKKVLAGIYEEIGEFGSARKLQKDLKTPAGENKDFQKEDLVEPPRITRNDVVQMHSLFKGRELGYAIQEIDQAGRAVFHYHDLPLKGQKIIDHIMGRITIGIYLLRKDKTLKLFSIWLKVNKKRLMENFKNKSYIILLEEKVHEYSARITALCRSFGISAYIDYGGEYDRRVWFFFSEFLSYQLVENFAKNIFNQLPATSSDIQVEVFLGLQSTGIGWQHAPILLPFGINRKTGNRCLFLEHDGRPFADQPAFIQKVRSIKGEIVRKYLNHEYRKMRNFHEAVPKPPDAILKLTRSCSILDETIRKARSGRSLSNNEKLLIFYTVGLINDNMNSIHYTLEHTPDYRPDKVERLVSQLRPNPMSCPKIRELLPEVTTYKKCDCTFVIPDGGYPSPLIYVDPKLVERKKIMDFNSQGTLQEASRKYIHLYREYAEINKALSKLESVIISMLKQKHTDEVKTPLGNLKKMNEHLTVKL